MPQAGTGSGAALATDALEVLKRVVAGRDAAAALGPAALRLAARACTASALGPLVPPVERALAAACAALHDRLHTGSWHLTHPATRSAFAAASAMHAAWLWAAGLEAHALRVGDVGLMLGGPDAVPGFPEAMDALHALVLSAGPGAASCDSARRKRPRCRSLQPAERGPKRVAAAAEFAVAPAAAVLSGAAAPPPEPADSARSPVWLTGDEYLGAKALRDALGAGAAEVDAIDAGDVAAGFERGWYRPGLPVVIGRGLLEHWPARGACGAARSWRNGRRLWQCLAERSVPVEVGSSYMADDWGQGLMRGGAFLEEAFESVCAALRAGALLRSGGAGPAGRGGGTSAHDGGGGDSDACGDCGGGASSPAGCADPPSQAGAAAPASGAPAWLPAGVGFAGRRRTLYLAQHQLLDQIPSLRADVSVPELCSLSRQDDAPREPPQAGGTSDARGDCASGSNTEPGVPAADSEARTAGACQAAAPRINVWIGPAGTVSDLHTDPMDNLLCQVVGSKRVLLLAPAQGARLQAHEGPMANTATADPEAAEVAATLAQQGATLLSAVVGPGEVLFIPKGWWHHVRSLTPSISLSFWWS